MNTQAGPQPTIAVAATAGRSGRSYERNRDAELLRAYFGPNAAGLEPGTIDRHRIAQFERNKLSPLARTADPARFAELADDCAHHAARLRDRQRRWQRLLPRGVAIFEQAETAHVLMKALRSPFALMSDVDFLVPWPHDVVRAAELLETEGFSLYRFRLLAHPLKIMAIPPGQGLGEPPQVDIYPDAMWVRRHVMDGVNIVNRRRRLTVHEAEAWLPDAADDVYLVATHALARGDITLAELDHGARVILGEGPFDWSRMVSVAEAFGCQDSVYAYLRVLVYVARQAGQDVPVPDEVLRELESSPAARPIKRWLDRAEPTLALPLAFPIWTSTIRAALHHLPAVCGRISTREFVMDAAAHGLAVGAHLLKRD